MLPASFHPLSPSGSEEPPPTSPSPSLPRSILDASPTSTTQAPLFPASLSADSSPLLNPTLAIPTLPAGYFTPRAPTPSSSGPGGDHSIRPALASNLTIRAPPPLPPPPPVLLPPPRHFFLPLPPHHLPKESHHLAEVERSTLEAVVRALSRELEESRKEVERRGEECKALEKVLRDKGVGEGELERTRLRARVGDGIVEGKEGKEWKLDLIGVGVGVDEGEDVKEDEDGVRREYGVEQREEVETVLDLEDLAEAISENAFSFSSNSIVELASPSQAIQEDADETFHAPTESPPDLDEQEEDDNTLVTPIPSSSRSDDGRSPTPPPSNPSSPTKPARQRHPSLSSRIFNSFSLSSAPSNPSSSTPSPASASASSSTLTVPSTNPTSPNTGKRKHKRAGSIASVSSIASANSNSSEANKETAGYADWMAWRSWTMRGKDKDKLGGGGSVLGKETTNGDGLEESTAEDEETQDDDEEQAGLGLDLGRRRGDSNTTSAGGDDANVGLSSSVASLTTQATTTRSFDAPSSPTMSTSPPSSTSPFRRPNSPQSTRSRIVSMPRLVSQHAPISPALSTPTPTSTLSTPQLSAPSQLTRGLSHSRKSLKLVEASMHTIVHPSHFTAVALAAGRWLAGSHAAIFRTEKIGERVKELADGLMKNVASGAGPSSERQANGDGEVTIKGKVKVNGKSKPDGKILSKKPVGSNPPFIEVPVPLYSAPELPNGGPKIRERGYVSSAKGTIGRALGLGASASASLTGGGGVSRSASGLAMDVASAGGEQPNLTMFPKLSNLSRYSPFAQPALSTPSTTVSLSSHGLGGTSHAPLPPPSNTQQLNSAPTTMELDTISGEAAPPTLALHNPATGKNAGDDDEGPMVDRYGFVYDVRSGMKLLREARKRKELAAGGDALRKAVEGIEEASAPTPLSLDIESKEEENSQVEVEAELEMLREALGLPHSTSTSPSHPRSPVPRSGNVNEEGRFHSSRSLNHDLAPPNSSSRSPSPRSPPTTRPSKLVRSHSSDGPNPPTTAGGQQSMKRLLAHLTAMHDVAEKSQKEAWETFIGKRQAKLRHSHANGNNHHHQENGPLRRGKRQKGGLNVLANEEGGLDADSEDEGWSENLVGVAQMGVAGKSGKEDWAEFKTLVRKGVPIAFRPKIWAECSGANEAREPGLYQELLARHQDEQNQCLTQIDMDCHRTFPTNVFFAGTGPGVAKLRNVLVAYSWRNPKIGYCQGMNNLTATLLLTHPAEEDAFWVLVCLIEKILPSDYYTSHLLVSQADQRVLRDLVERHMPDIAAHLEDLGVELPAVTFGWFLSLFTDALPIQTLLRVWDLLFVFGTVILFRVAVAVLQMNSADILACDSAATLYALMRTMTTHLYQVDRLIKIASEDLRTVVKDRDISLLRNRHVAELQAELCITPDEDDE